MTRWNYDPTNIKTVISISMSSDIANTIRGMAKKEDRKISTVVTRLLEKGLAEEKKESERASKEPYKVPTKK